MKTILTLLGTGRIVALLICALLAGLSFYLKFCIPGYSFSALVCMCLIAIILFYTFIPLVGLKFPDLAKWTTRICTTILAAGLLVVGITEGIIIHKSFGDPQEQVEYVVVLGAKVNFNGPSVSLWDRIYGAADYLQANPDVIAVVSGGQGADEPMTEGQAMYDELVKLGIPGQRIWIEDQATSTRENITFALDLIEEKTGSRPDTLGVVSSEYHLFRAGLLTRECGVEFVGIPAKTSRLSQLINHLMREAAGVWEYLIFGG